MANAFLNGKNKGKWTVTPLWSVCNYKYVLCKQMKSIFESLNLQNNSGIICNINACFPPLLLLHLLSFVSLLFFLLLQTRGRRDPPRDLPAFHPTAVLPGDVHNRDAQVYVPAGGAAATPKKYHHKTYSNKYNIIQNSDAESQGCTS